MSRICPVCILAEFEGDKDVRLNIKLLRNARVKALESKCCLFVWFNACGISASLHEDL